MKRKKTTRVQIELPDASMSRLRDLKDRTEAGSYADVIRSAFLVYERFIDLIDDGQSLKTVNEKTGKEREFIVFVPSK